MASVPELLLHTLNELTREDLMRFKWYLKHDGRIRTSVLEHADRIDIVDKMVQYFGAEGAVEITVNILRKINQNHLAEELENNYTEVQTVSAAEKHRRKQDDSWLQKFMETHKMNMKRKVEHIFEGKKENKAHLEDVFTELYITEGNLEEVNQEHEIMKIDDTIKPRKTQNRRIRYNFVFDLNKNKEKIVLTKGVAGIGKTVSVHKFILDWAEGKANQNIDCVFLLPFRKINCIKDGKISLHEFLQRFNPELQDLEAPKIYKIYKHKLAFIFDGLDESRLTLNFVSEIERSVEEQLSIDELFTSLVNGTLLPSAHVWVTSRPAAANQIPRKYVGLFTEVRGFTDPQKDKYFQKRITDETQASRMISHIKKSRSLYIMCHIPVFCWITATVLQDIPIGNSAENIVSTLTEMYIHFLLIQMNMKNQKHGRETERDCPKLLESNKTMILKLAKLAFEQLKKENIVFYEEDLRACGIDVSEEDFESTGMLTEIFQQEAGLGEKVFSFVHLSVQEFLAAVYVFLCYLNKNMDELQFFTEETQNELQSSCEETQRDVRPKRAGFLWSAKLHKTIKSVSVIKKPDKNIALHYLLKKAVEKAMQSQKGHLDLFLRFLMGISLESNQKLLRGLFPHTEDCKDSVTEITKHIKELLQNQDISPEISVNLFYCLLELNDNSLYKDIQRYFRSSPERPLSSSMCSLMAYVLLMSEEVLEELNPRRYSNDPGCHRNLLPAVRCCKRAILSSCGLNDISCETVALALKIPNSPLIELDMSFNELPDYFMKLLSDGLTSSNCQLKKLSLAGCNLNSQDCEIVSSALQFPNCVLRELDLSNNELKDSGVEWLSGGLESQNCQLHILRLSGCRVTEKGCNYLSSALSLNPSHLRELDLRNNELQNSGVKLLSDKLKDPNFSLQILNVDHCGRFRSTAGLHKWACDLTLDPNTANTYLILSDENRKITCVEDHQSYPDHPERFDDVAQVLCGESLTGHCYWEAEWSGDAEISVTYKGISRKGVGDDCVFGCNDKSWSLDCSNKSYSVRHNKNSTYLPVISSSSNRVGVYVDVSAGILSFYSVSDTHTLTHLHTFNTTFTEPLYAGFTVHSYSSVSLCDIKQPPVRNNSDTTRFSCRNDLQMTPTKEEDQKNISTATTEKDKLPLNSEADKVQFYDKYWSKLIQRVTNIKIIADELHQQEIINMEQYYKITHVNSTSQDSMRELCNIISTGKIDYVKAEFISVLQKVERCLLEHWFDSSS
ncbi:NACHT, LRR and PYD domains-containing protein 3-like [Megalobrama amblycephala]|uniref:NACHT, LRR and PYD domains-containing protein 3-like n=1 Tax=Megalobrama amblycephala TaxID=75352 RepID=UPI002014704D|nr:NACHT, LRR and PYD domains-containing protein 3-like [Megalobrama amblycephala]XP_048051573.1 NACHT, LRR and PYD domains-containing protein 3-like [Megalobrama amblycephala]